MTVERISESEARSRIDTALASLGMTWDELCEASVDYTLDAAQRGLAQTVDGLRFLLGMPGLPCCRSCMELDDDDEAAR